MPLDPERLGDDRARPVRRGFSDEYGSWKIICISRRSGRSARLRPVRDVLPVVDDLAARRLEQARDEPRRRRLPAAGSRRRARASRRARSRTRRRRRRAPAPLAAEEHAAGIGKCLTRSRTARSGARRVAAPRRSLDGHRSRPRGRRLSRPCPRAQLGADLRRRTGRWQATRWPAPRREERRAPSLRQIGITYGQRGWKGQPLGDVRSGSAACPRSGAGARRAEVVERSGSTGAGPTCTGARARRGSPVSGPCSTTRPAYITATSSAVSAITPRSCVMSTTAVPSSCWSVADQLEDLRLDGDVERRRRLVGDQDAPGRGRAPSRSSRAAASRRRARAGSCRAGSAGFGIPTARQRLERARPGGLLATLARAPGSPRRSASRSCRAGGATRAGPGRSSRRACRGRGGARRPGARAGRRRRGGPRPSIVAFGSRVRPITVSAVTLLPEPGLADDAERAAALDRERDAVDRVHDAVSRLETTRAGRGSRAGATQYRTRGSRNA